jgi:hypothetical protein
MKVGSDVLLLSYFDKICLIPTGDLWQTLACLYSEARLYKGPREATRPQSTTLHSSLGRYVFGSEISYNKAPPRLPGLGC